MDSTFVATLTHPTRLPAADYPLPSCPSSSAHLLALHCVEPLRLWTFESVSGILGDGDTDLSEVERMELERLRRATGSCEARRRFMAIALGWRQAVSSLTVVWAYIYMRFGELPELSGGVVLPGEGVRGASAQLARDEVVR